MNRSGADRLRMSSDMFSSARTLVMASLSPKLSNFEVRVRLCERFYSKEVDVHAFAVALRRNAV